MSRPESEFMREFIRLWRELRKPVMDPATLPQPEGVWFEYADGQRYEDLPLIFLERRADGIAMWDVLCPRDPDEERPVSVGARVWPGMCGLNLPPLAGHP